MRAPSLTTRILNGYFRLFQWVVTLLMGLMIIPVSLQIVARYTDFIPRYIWTEEAARFCFIWIIMLGASIAVREGTHFTVDVLPKPASRRLQALNILVVQGFMLVVTLVFVLYGWNYATFGYSQTSELTGINMVFIHAVYLLAGFTWLVFIGEHVWTAVRLWRGVDDVAR